MVHLVSSTDSFVKVRAHGVDVECRVVGEDIHDDLDIVFGRRVKHLFHFLFASDDGVAYLPVGGLVIIIPVALFPFLVKKFLGRPVRIIAVLHWRGLYHRVA